MIYKAIHIANKIIDSIDAEHGEVISNLKLQKLLYYVQGFHIAVFEKRLFKEDIEAWQYGPVVKEVYNHFNTFGSKSIELEKNAQIVKLNPEEEALFQEVMEEYGQFSAIKLMNMTHSELPWKTVFSKTPSGIITEKLLKEYFKTQLVA